MVIFCNIKHVFDISFNQINAVLQTKNIDHEFSENVESYAIVHCY